MECPLCKSNKPSYTTFKDSKSKAIINVCNKCYLVYQQQNNNINYYDIKCGTTKAIDKDKHSRDVADYIFNFSKEFFIKELSKELTLNMSAVEIKFIEEFPRLDSGKLDYKKLDL